MARVETFFLINYIKLFLQDIWTILNDIYHKNYNIKYSQGGKQTRKCRSSLRKL